MVEMETARFSDVTPKTGFQNIYF